MTDRRNPYLILGIDHGADASQAAGAFAQATRRVRSDDAPYEIEDITWALHRIENAEADPQDSLDAFRVPADPTVYLDTTVEALLPAPTPLPRTTSQPGQGRQLTKDQALLEEMQFDLSEATERLLNDAVIEPDDVDLDPQPPLQDRRGHIPGGGTSRQPVAPIQSRSQTENHRSTWYIVLIVVALAVLLAIVVSVAEDDPDSAPDEAEATSTGPNSDPDPEPDPAPEPDPDPTPEPESQVTPWVQRGDCLTEVAGGRWETSTCVSPDAEVVSTHRGARTDVCPPGVDMWFDDEWGVYCALIVSDNTADGGHWGIGPVRQGTCLEIGNQGGLVGKAMCTSSTVPVLTVATHPDGCSLVPALSDYYVYWEAIDGTSNVLCIDGFHWDQAGHPPPS